MGNTGDLIVEKRKERGLTQVELGAMLGISGKAVSKWERGLSKPCEEHLEKLVALLGLPVESTITAEGKENAQRTTFFYRPQRIHPNLRYGCDDRCMCV